MLKEQIGGSIKSIPNVEGPIAVTESSHPFSAMTHARIPLNLEDYGYVEEEYFVSGTANVYEETADSREMEIVRKGVPYKNRIFIRKPRNPLKSSGNVILEIYNPSNGYDIEDIWRRSYEKIMETKDIYIGITSKPIAAYALQQFDEERYKTLDWGNGSDNMVVSPENKDSVVNAEEGLIWDMISQLAYLLRTEKERLLDKYPVSHLFLSGQSQAGMYLNTYAYYFHPYIKGLGEVDDYLFNGYINIVGAGTMRKLKQEEKPKSLFSIVPQKVRNMDIPFLFLSAQGDLEFFKDLDKTENITQIYPDSMIRQYELAGAPHSDPTSSLVPSDNEIEKTGCQPKKDYDEDKNINTLKLSYYVNTIFTAMINWVVNSTEPPVSNYIKRDEHGEIEYDRFGNAVGGVRSPYLDVPIATYYPNSKSGNKSNFDELVYGTMEYFSYDKLIELYGSRSNYLTKFLYSVHDQIKNKYLIPSDTKRIMEWAEVSSKALFVE